MNYVWPRLSIPTRTGLSDTILHLYTINICYLFIVIFCVVTTFTLFLVFEFVNFHASSFSLIIWET